MRKINYILFILIFVIFNNSFSQDYIFEHYTVDDGLSQSAINCIMQSSDGYLWFGTQEGLNRFNGYDFKYYNHDPLDTNSLTSNWVWDIAEDNSQNIWVATIFGLNRINRYTGKITRYVNNPKDPNSLPYNEVQSVIVDKQNNVWVKTKNVFSKLDIKTGTFESFEHEEDLFYQAKVDYPTNIVETEDGFWMGSNAGLQFFSKEYKQFKKYSYNNLKENTISSNVVYAILKDRNGNLWISTNNGLNNFNPKTEIFTRYYHDSNNPNTISSNFIVSLYEDHLGNIWAGTTTHGVDRIDSYGNITHFKNEKNNGTGINSNEIVSIYEDVSQNIWFGSNGNGLNKISLLPRKFKLYKYTNGSKIYNFSSNMIASIYEYNENTLWIGTWDAGLNILDKSTGKVRVFTTDSPKGERIAGNNVHVILKLKNGNILLGTRNGISIFHTESELFENFAEEYNIEFIGLRTNRIFSMIEDHKGNIWIGAANGLYKINMQTYEVSLFTTNYKDSTSISDNQVNIVFEDNEGYIWVGTQNGLNRFDIKKHIFKRFYSQIGKNAKIKDELYRTISSNIVYSILEDNQGYLWLGTGNGINKYDKIKGTFKYYTKKHGLPNETIYELQMDNNGKMWFSTNRGIGYLDRNTEQIKNFDKGDGLQGLEFNNGASCKSPTGTLYFGGVEGLNEFNPDSIKLNSNLPKLVFESYKKFTKNGQIIKELIGVDQIQLNYDDKLIKIKFAALEFTNPKKNQYRYKLEGYDENWMNLENKHELTLSSLPPGDYIFRLQGSNNDLVWGKEKNIKIIVKSPFYTTIWAYIIYILFVSFIVFAIIRIRTSKLKASNQILQQKQIAALEIKKQKDELDILVKNIKDSITYAERIQKAMMPSESLIKKLLHESFIFYLPKDIVSGDFYWVAEKGNKVFIAAVDCTGHGVPGAFMSIIGFDLLRSITREQGVENPGEILNKLSHGVAETFSRNIGEQSVKDGMDMALVVLDKTKNILEFAGALNPVYIVRQGRIIEIKGNRFSIGSVENDEKFDTHKIPIKKDDMVYIFSDGYADQFGGSLGKKYKFRRFRHTLLTISSMPVNKQKSFLIENIENWMGDLEQVDDMLIIGFRI